jgi:hypothetical protein
MKKTLLFALILFLAACLSPSGDNPAPQTDSLLPSGEGQGMGETPPPPTDTPAPASTPVAVDGVATIDGVLYVFDEAVQEWVALPELDGEFERVMVTEDERIVALDDRDAELYELSTTGEWVMAVPEQWREFAAGLPKGARMDAEAGRVYDNLNNVLYVLDVETNEWWEPKVMMFPESFGVDPKSIFETTGTVEVDGVSVTIPMTLGVTKDMTGKSVNRLTKIEMTELGAEATAWLWMHAFLERYNMSNPEVTLAEYLKLVEQGKGQVEIVVLGRSGVASKVKVDPRRGVTVACGDEKEMPVMYATGLGFGWEVDESGGVKFQTNTCRNFGDTRYYNPDTYVRNVLDNIFVRDVLNVFSTAMAATPDECIRNKGCRSPSFSPGYVDVSGMKLTEALISLNEGKTKEELFVVKR